MFKFNQYSTTIIFLAYFCTFPLWLWNVSLIQLLFFYFVFWFINNFVQSLFLHRWAAHNQWTPPSLMQKILSPIGAAAGLGTPIGWAAWHRTHHHYSDTDKDPHSPKIYSWWYIIFGTKFHRAEPRRAVDRFRNSYISNITKYEGFISVCLNLLLAIVIISCLNFQWFLTLWAIPTSLTIVLTNWGLNVIAHSKNDEARDIKWWYPFLFFERDHGQHHNKPMQISFDGTWDPAYKIAQILRLVK